MNGLFNVALQIGYETNIPSLVAQRGTLPSLLASMARHTLLVVLQKGVE